MAKKQTFRLLVLLPESSGNAMTLHCARIITRARRGQFEVLHHQRPRSATENILSSQPDQQKNVKEDFINDFPSFLQAVENRVKDAVYPISMLAIGWSDNQDKLQEMLKLIIRLNLPGLVVNWPPDCEVERILFPSSGGLHTVPQVWIVSELAKAINAPVHLLRIVRSSAELPANGKDSEEEAKLTRLLLRMLGLHMPVETEAAGDVISGVQAAVKPNDLLIIGGPNYGRVMNHFHNSIPDVLIRGTRHPAIMLLAGKPQKLPLQNVFWEETISLNLPPRNYKEFIALLVDTLVKQRQLPAEWRQYVLCKALKREQIRSTSVGCETAFPHVAIPQFTGITGCLGICPEGLDFGNPEQPLVHFVFLMITPSEDYQDYLITIAQLARRMMKPTVRKALLASRTPAEAQLVLIGK